MRRGFVQWPVSARMKRHCTVVFGVAGAGYKCKVPPGFQQQLWQEANFSR